MSIGRMNNFNFSHRQSNLVKTPKKNTSDGKVSLTPGLITGLVTGGAAHVTLNGVTRTSQNTVMSKIAGSMAKKAEDIFTKETLNKISRTNGIRAKTAAGIALGTMAITTGLVRMFGGIVKPVFTSPESSTK